MNLSHLSQELIQKAIDSSVAAQRDWERQPYEKRADVFIKAAKLMQDEYRMDLMATTMLGQVRLTAHTVLDFRSSLTQFVLIWSCPLRFKPY